MIDIINLDANGRLLMLKRVSARRKALAEAIAASQGKVISFKAEKQKRGSNWRSPTMADWLAFADLCSRIKDANEPPAPGAA